MRIFLSVLLLGALTLSACGWRDSRINPRNWFGNSREVPVETVVETNPLIPRRSGLRPAPVDTSVPIDRVTELRIEPTNSGAIVYASGIAQWQGAYNARLVPVNRTLTPDENGVLEFSFRVVYPRRSNAVGSEFSRTVHEAFSLSDQDLAAIRTIRVTGARNAQESRRR